MTTTPEIDPAALPSGTGCAECEDAAGWWLHLRRCTSCGHIGCCDSSPAQHARGHAAATGHPIMTSFEPGENWFWDFRSEEYHETDVELSPPHHHPESQPVPGPADRLPADWRNHLH
jgi:hypothetical protein